MEYSTTNPGEQLRNFLKKLYPQNSEAQTEELPNNFIDQIDRDLIANGDFSNIVYESSINYLVRRLITTAEFLGRTYKKENFNQDKTEVSIKWKDDLRNFFWQNTNFTRETIETLVFLIEKCLVASKKKLKTSRKRRIRKKQILSSNDIRCYICGRSLSELSSIDELKSDDEEIQEEIQVEHIFPRAMGGLTEDFNLKVSCSKCNGIKQDYIDASDFHYEKICLKSTETDESFKTELDNRYRVALWSKSNFRCKICNKEAAEAGRLQFSRSNPGDSWHFLNIEAFCEEHYQMIKSLDKDGK
jgi:phage FluMu protein Com